MNNEHNILARKAAELTDAASRLSNKLNELAMRATENTPDNSDHFVQLLTVFLLACFVGYHVVWKVTPALHTPLMSITNAISGIIIIGALMVTGFEEVGTGTIFGVAGIFLASINIFGGFVVTRRMLKMFDTKHTTK